MTWRGPVVLALLLVLGAGTGYAASLATSREAVADGVPAPVAASSPSMPVDPVPSYVPDPTDPPLPVDLPMGQGGVGTEPFRHVFPVPRGWVATPNSANETKWTDPATPPSWTYVLRVEQVGSENETVERMLAERIEDLTLAEDGFEVVARTGDSLTFSYVTDGHLRFGILRWLDVTGSGFAEVEVAVTGREVDLPGMAALVAQVTGGIRRA